MLKQIYYFQYELQKKMYVSFPVMILYLVTINYYVDDYVQSLFLFNNWKSNKYESFTFHYFIPAR